MLQFMKFGYFILSVCFCVSLFLHSMEEQKKKIILQFNDNNEVELDYDIAQSIPTIRNVLVDCSGHDQLKIPLQNMSSDEWHVLSKYLPIYNEWWDLEKNGPDKADEKTVTVVQSNNALTLTYKKTGYWLHSQRWANKEEALYDFQKKLDEIHLEEKYKKIFKLSQKIDETRLEVILKLFYNVDYLAMYPLNQIVATKITKMLSEKNHFINYMQNKETYAFMNSNLQNNIMKIIKALEDKEKRKKIIVNRRSGEQFVTLVDIIHCAHDGSIIRCFTKEIFNSYPYEIGRVSNSKPKISLLQHSQAEYNFIEFVFLHCIKKEWQLKNRTQSVKNKKKHLVPICAKHTPELFEMYEAVKNKNSVVQIIVDARKCSEPVGWNIVGRLSYNKDLCIDEVHAQSIERTTKRKSLLVFSGLLSAGVLVHGLYNQNNTESVLATAALSGSALGYFLINDKTSDA